VFNIITLRTLLAYAQRYPDAANALYEWYHEFKKQDFNSFQELKEIYGNASIVGDNRIVFNILGNHFRLVVRISFVYRSVQLKWFGPHKEYDRIDVYTVQP
jgi:mRNA interferase HigB